MAKRSKRRIWTDEEKIEIVGQTDVPGISVAQVARRYQVNTNMVFKWRRDPRYRPSLSAAPALPCEGGGASFLPVEVSDVLAELDISASAVEAAPDSGERTAPAITHDVGIVEIRLAGGHGLTLRGCFDADAVLRLIWGLSS